MSVSKAISAWLFFPPFKRVFESICLCILLTLSNCVSIDGGPPRLFTLQEETASARARVQGWEDSYYTTLPSKAVRNEIISARMRAIDIQYYAFEASIIRERQEAGFVSSIVSLALSGAVPLFSAVVTKNILGAASSGLQGATKAYSDEVLFQKTVQVLAAQMQARRNLVAADIIMRMNTLDVDTYTLSMAQGDTDEYYAAGTIAGALVEIQKTVSAEASSAEAAKNSAVASFKFSPDAASEILYRNLYPGGKLDGAMVSKLLPVLEKISNKTGLDLRDLVGILDNPKASKVRSKLVEQSGIR